MGVEGIHMYAVVADFILSPNGGGYMHYPGTYKALTIENHRLLRWNIFHPSPWSLHYYGQWLIYNDCAFRWRHYYEFLLFVDRDEFLHFSGRKPHEVRCLLAWSASVQNACPFKGRVCPRALVHKFGLNVTSKKSMVS
jgi:hypothetical protein